MNGKFLLLCSIISSLCCYQQDTLVFCEVSDVLVDDEPISDAPITPISILPPSNLVGYQVLTHSYLTDKTSTMLVQNVKTGTNHIAGTNSIAYTFKSNTTRYGVYEPDNRKCLDANINSFPLTSIGFMEYRLGTELHCGTGFLIGNGLVVSAAHCIFNKTANAFYSSPSIMFGKTNGQSYVATAQIVEAYIPYQYYSQSSNDENYDWAILKLSEDNLQETYGALSIGSSYSLSDKEYSSYGYFSSTEYGINASLYVSTAYDVQEESGLVYKTYSYVDKGMSGGPVVGYYTEPDERDPNVELSYEMIVGINSCKAHNDYYNRNYLVATKISNELITLAEVIA